MTDPTVLTTQQLDKGLENLRQLFEARLVGISKEVGSISSIKELQARHEERLHSVDERMQLQFEERDVRTEQMSRDSKVAVDAALQAAKEAVSEQNKSNEKAILKSEAATTKQIDAISVLISTMTKATEDKINDLKERLDEKKGRSKGVTDFAGWIFGAGMFLLALWSLMEHNK